MFLKDLKLNYFNYNPKSDILNLSESRKSNTNNQSGYTLIE
jgi:hypothetical protein